MPFNNPKKCFPELTDKPTRSNYVLRSTAQLIPYFALQKCFTCGNCSRPLDSVLCCDAPDGDIYCKGCYAKTFGAKGYGYGGGAGTLQCADL